MANKMMSPAETIWWVPADTPSWNPDAPSAAILTEARNISCAVVSGYTLNPTDSDTDDTTSICNSSNSADFTFYNYEANLTFFREEQGANANNTSAYARAFKFFKNVDADGYLVRRMGYLESTPAAASQEVSVFYVQSDYPQDVVPDDGGPIQFTVPFLPQGKMNLNIDLVA